MIKLLYIIIPVIVISGCDINKGNETVPVVRNGVLDISHKEMSSPGTIKLDGKWEFYWNKLLEPSDFNNNSINKPEFITVPGSWDKHFINNKRLPLFGYATYRLIIKTAYKGELALMIYPPTSSYKVWINGKFIVEKGIVGKSEDEAITDRSHEIINFFPAKKGENEIIIQVSNYYYVYSGIIEKLKFGTKKNIRKEREKGLSFDLFLFGSLLIIGLYHLGIFLLRRNDPSTLWFGLFSICLGFYSIFINELFFLFLYPTISGEHFVRLCFITVSLAMPLLITFFYYFFIGSISKYILKIFWTTSISLFLIGIIFPGKIFPKFNNIIFVNIICGCLCILYSLIKSVKNKIEGSVIAISGFLILFLSAINDILFTINILHTTQLSPFGLLIFILAHSFNLSRRFSNAHKRIEELSIDLSIKVDERTEELARERNKLMERNIVIEKEIFFGRKIQQNMLPVTSPKDYVYSLYKPLEEIGGDFFDYIQFRDSNKIGIFISDVTGHGVPAALITCMVKTIILQTADEKNSPAELLKHLNSLLYNQTAGNFVTAFYGIYEPDKNIMTYSNAGHYPPFVVSKNELRSLGGKKSPPLAVMSNKLLDSKNSLYQNVTVDLNINNKLIFYTDGMVENIKNGNNFFIDDIYIKKITDSTNLPVKEFVENLFNLYIDYRGDEDFEDDICLIGVDVK